MSLRAFFLTIAAGIVAVHGWLATCAHAQVSFVDRAADAGLVAEHFDGGGRQVYLPQLMVAGLAVFDFDGDGWSDIYLLSGCELGPADSSVGSASSEDASGGSTKPAQRRGNTLYRNNHDGTFTDVTQQAGVASGRFALGAVAADLDNDGDQDLVTSNFGPAQLFVNNGDGTFSDNSQRAGIAGSSDQFGAGVACLDIDNDGLLDLLASNYVEFSYSRHAAIAPRAFPYPPGPKDYPPSSDRLYRNRGDGTFADVSESSGIAAMPGPTMGVICGDFDGDGDADMFLCSDAAANQYFVNDGTGKFVDDALAAGVAFDLSGHANGSMGVDSGDYDHDGLIDLLLTNYTGQMPVLYRNLGGGLFEDASRLSGVGRGIVAHTNWGVALLDVDNDRDLDAFFANGHFLKNIDSIDDRTSYRVPNTLMLSDGRGRFTDASASAGSGLRVTQSSRGAGVVDFDADGDLDLVVLNANAPPTLLENRSPHVGAWVDVQLVGRTVNRDAVGAAVRLTADGQAQTAMVHAGRGYQSHYGTVLHFGLGTSQQQPAADEPSIEVTWPGGKREQFPCKTLNRTLLLIEGSGEPALGSARR